MAKDKLTTEVVFRKYNSGGAILALFPYDVEKNGNVTCYEHVGQHGTADYHHCIHTLTKPATPSEARNLKAELRGIGYKLKVIKRRQYSKYLNSYKTNRHEN